MPFLLALALGQLMDKMAAAFQASPGLPLAVLAIAALSLARFSKRR
jgi:hypothetical protein